MSVARADRRSPRQLGVRRLAALVTIAALAASAVFAGDPPAPSSDSAIDQARDAWKDLNELVHSTLPESPREREIWLRQRNDHVEEFHKAFAKTDLDAWTLPAESEPFTLGATLLYGTACSERRFDDARRVLDAHVRRLPDDPWSLRAKREFIPDVLVAKGDVAGAAAYCAEWESRVAGIAKVHLCLRLGDLRGVMDDEKGRDEAYAAADAAFKAWDRKHGLGDEFFGVYSSSAGEWLEAETKGEQYTRSQLFLQYQSTNAFHVTASVPPLAADWGRLRGKVLVLIFCYEFDGDPARFKALDAFAKSQAGKPVQTLVVVRAGGLPGFKTSGKQRVAEYLAAVRAKGPVASPFALVADEEFPSPTDWLHGHRDFVVVADGKGKFVHAGAGVPSEIAVFGIAQFLAGKLSDPAAPPPATGTPPK